MITQILEIIGILANLAVVAGVIIAVLQLHKLVESNRLQREAAVADHDRRRKQSTIEFFTVINNETHLLLANLREQYGTSPLTMEQINKDAALRKSVRRYLTLMERLAVGIRTRVYDIDVINHICGESIISNYKRFYEFIRWRQKDAQSKTVYREFENLVKDLEAQRRGEDVIREFQVKEVS